MPKPRVIPVLLTDGLSLVKGESFNSWRTVSSVVAAARVFALRDVDELVLLDVAATAEGRHVDPALVTSVAECLHTPLTCGGGLCDLNAIEKTLRAGADKVVLGTIAQTDPGFVTRAADVFGSQAVVVSIDVADSVSRAIAIQSGRRVLTATVGEAVAAAQGAGCGEILLQSVERDGLMVGMDFDTIAEVCRVATVPVVVSGGAATYDDLYRAVSLGASGVAAGAMFQFTQQTPRGARDYLTHHGLEARVG